MVTSYGKRHLKAYVYPNLAYVLHDNHAKGTVAIHQVLTSGDTVTLFDGKIKNKSEYNIVVDEKTAENAIENEKGARGIDHIQFS